MDHPFMLTRRAAVLAGLAAAAGVTRAADIYPSRVVRLVVPFSTGGPTDTLARIIAERMTALLGQTVIVDNRAGAGGNIGAALVAKAAPDGYTLLLGTNNQLAANLSVFTKLPFDPVADFEPIGMISYSPSVVAVTASFPANNVAELVALLKQKPTAYSFASGGIGASSHFAGELMNRLAGVQMTHVPYKSDGLAVTDTIGGQVPIVFCNIASALKFRQSGQLKVLGVTSAKRAPVAQDIPTIAESGLPGFDISAWFCLMAPAKTPAAIVARLNETLDAILREPVIAERIAAMGNIPAPSTPAQVSELIRTEIPKWGALAKSANIHLD